MSRIIIITVIILLKGTLLSLSTVSAEENTRREFRLGIISRESRKIINEFIPMMEYISSRLKEIDYSRVVVVTDVEDMILKIQSREVDVVFDSAFPTIIMEEVSGLIPSLIIWEKGVREYRTLFFVRQESPVRTLSDLKGKSIVFEAVDSTSAYAVPKAELIRAGMNVLPLGDIDSSDNTVQYMFAGQEKNQGFYVVQKKADAGAFDNNDWDEIPEKIRADLRIIHETKPILRYIGSFHPDYPKKLRSSVQDIFIRMDQDPEGREALRRAMEIKKIEKMKDNDYRSLEYIKSIVHSVY